MQPLHPPFPSFNRLPKLNSASMSRHRIIHATRVPMKDLLTHVRPRIDENCMLPRYGDRMSLGEGEVRVRVEEGGGDADGEGRGGTEACADGEGGTDRERLGWAGGGRGGSEGGEEEGGDGGVPLMFREMHVEVQESLRGMNGRRVRSVPQQLGDPCEESRVGSGSCPRRFRRGSHGGPGEGVDVPRHFEV